MTITILTDDIRWKGLAPTVRRAAAAALHPRNIEKLAITILLTNDAKMKRLNHEYRGKNKPTNVLSFPDGMTTQEVTHWGDIALAYDTIAREAKEQNKLFKSHLAHLTVHGVLHLLGYGHEMPNEAARMEKREITILSSMGIANPYELP